MTEDNINAALNEAAVRAETQPVTTAVKGAPTPSEMLRRAREAGKTEAEINAFAASQPMKPIAIQGTRVFVQDCFGRTFGLDNVPEKELAALVTKGIPYTPYSNRNERRNDVRIERKPHTAMALPVRPTLRQMQRELAETAAALRAQLSVPMRNVLATIERNMKVSRKEYEALLAEVTRIKQAAHDARDTVEFGDVLAAQNLSATSSLSAKQGQ